ncbi:MAG TPA: hypothetical protein VGV61_14375, partial [Thermoanaerobaculia bacterium]|nr:hypothetical protein [Thermoanaerobaculia bacterium]
MPPAALGYRPTAELSSWLPSREAAKVTSGEGAATLGAVAELVINLSIAQRSRHIYGGEHVVAKRSAARAAETLRQALQLQAPITVHFTPKAVFCGSHCLERGHPIYR